MMDDIFLVLL